MPPLIRRGIVSTGRRIYPQNSGLSAWKNNKRSRQQGIEAIFSSGISNREDQKPDISCTATSTDIIDSVVPIIYKGDVTISYTKAN
jgi:hypothetical protein